MTTRFLGPDGRTEEEADPFVNQRVLGDYIIKRLLGIGGMGAVYLAEDPDIGRIAVKVIHEEFSRRGDMATRFIGEARAASSIGNPHIVKFVAKGKLPDGRVFLAMEYLDGASLETCLGSWGVLSPPRALALLAMACWALHDAHEKGIVHRDIKPDNLYWIPEGPGEYGTLKVLDFGIAKMEDARLAGGVVTRTGAVLGTPTYMSPEQATGLRVDHRSDIYSMSIVAHRMVTGVIPQAQLGGGGWRDPRELRPDLPPLFASGILDGLAFRPELRPSSIRAWLRILLNSDPQGPDIARTYAHGFNFDVADPDERTRERMVPSVAAVATPTPHGIEQGRASTPASRTRTLRWPLAAGLAAAGASALAVALVTPRDDGTPARRGAASEASAVSTPVPIGSAPAIDERPRHPATPGGTAPIVAIDAGVAAVAAARTSSAPPAPRLPKPPNRVGEPTAVAGTSVSKRPPATSLPEQPDPGGEAMAATGISTSRLVTSKRGPRSSTRKPTVPPATAERAARSGTLHVDVTPWCLVELDGKPLGESPIKVDVPVGNHRVMLTNKKRTETVTVTIKADKTTTVERHW